MTRWWRHVRAAALRVWRQQSRSRRTWLALPAAGALSAASAGEAAPWPEVGAAVMFGFTFAIAITTIGAPGDDLASGAVAQDLLAGTPPSALVAGTVVGAVVAALPAFVTSLAAAVAGSGLSRAAAPWSAIALGIGAMVIGGVALAASCVWLGTVLTGRAAAALSWPLTFVGFLPGDALPLDHLSPSLADACRAAWEALPLPHHVVALLRAESGDHAGVAPHVWPLVVALVAAPLSAVLVLRLRIARGRWG